MYSSFIFSPVGQIIMACSSSGLELLSSPIIFLHGRLSCPKLQWPRTNGNIYHSLPKVLLHRGVIDIHFPDRGRWISITYPCPISQEYLWAPLAKTVRTTASHSSISGTKRASELLKFDCVLYYKTHFCWLWLWKKPFTYESSDTLLRNCHPCISIFVVVVLFYSGFQWEGEKKNTLPLHVMLKFKVFNIYLWEGNMGF